MMTSILLTGAGGFIGRRVMDLAGEAGYRVIPIVRKSEPSDVPNVIQRDLRIPFGKLPELPPVDCIFHLAGAYAGASYGELREADLTIARNLIDWGTATGVKNWVFASAAEIYGDVRGIAAENAPTEPVIPYGRIKLMIERLLIERTKNLSNCRVVVLRIGEVYGSEGRLIIELTTRLQRGFCPWPGKGYVPVSFVHVDDVAQAFLRAAQWAPVGVSIYNVADDVPVTWREFIVAVARRLGANPPAFLPTSLVRFYATCSTLAARVMRREPIFTAQALRLITTPKPVSNARLKQALRFEPSYRSYSEGLEEVLRGLPHNG